MRRSSFGRILGVLCLAGSLTYLGSAPASAAAPAWEMTAFPLPDTVHNGSGVAYQVTISNRGPSNISSLYLQTVRADVPVYLVNDAAHPACSSGTTARLSCAFGPLVAGDSVSITVGYQSPASGASFNPGFVANTTGASPNDKKQTSHGDQLQPGNDATTHLRSDKNFGGGFQLSRAAVSTDTAIGNKNIQSTTVVPPADDLVTTVEDGPDVSFSCPADVCTGKLFGEWSRVKVRSLDNFDNTVETFPAFPVALLVRGSAVSANNPIKLVHVTDSGAIDVLDQSLPCGSSPQVGCLDVTKTGGNYLLTTWVDQNGGFKGMG